MHTQYALIYFSQFCYKFTMVSKAHLMEMFTKEVGGRVDDVFIREFTRWLQTTYRPQKFEKKWLVKRAKEFFQQNL